MRKTLVTLCAVIISFGLGFLLAGGAPGSDSADSATTAAADLPAAATRMWFPPASEYATEGEPLSDESFDKLMAALDVAMTAEETLADFEREADLHIWNFVRRLATAEVTDEQKERIVDYLDALAEQHPDHRVMIEQREGLINGYAAAFPTMPSFSGSFTAFGDPEEYDTRGGTFDDARLDGLLARLDAVLTVPETVDDFEKEAGIHFWRFGGRLQQGRLTPEQTERIAAYLGAVKEDHPDAAETIDQHLFLVENLIPGNVAPNITGTDTEGVEFALEDYRGKIVALVFSGQWCGPCRGEYPYQRAMLDLYEEEDVVLLGVNSDAELETIVEAKKEERLPYRTWWDGHSQDATEGPAATKGPIATTWNVTGWPTIYVLDEEGVIRYVNKRGGGLIAAVDELLMDKRMREYEAGLVSEAEAETEEEDADEADVG